MSALHWLGIPLIASLELLVSRCIQTWDWDQTYNFLSYFYCLIFSRLLNFSWELWIAVHLNRTYFVTFSFYLIFPFVSIWQFSLFLMDPPPYQHNWWHLSIRKLRDLDDLTRKILSMFDIWSLVCGVWSHSVSGGEELQLGTEATQSAEPCWSFRHPQPSLHHHQDICQHNVTMKYYSDCGHVVTSAQCSIQTSILFYEVHCRMWMCVNLDKMSDVYNDSPI